MARIYRDDWGIPHVRATDVADLAFGQGEVTARDRAWQLEFLRRRATGTTAEIFGECAVGWDRLARRTLLANTARRCFEPLEPETRAFVTAYVDGVNAGLHADAPELDELDLEPGPWERWTPLAVFLVQHFLFAAMPGKLWRTQARTVLGEDAVLLAHEGPHSVGSNAWAVGAARTASGRPLIGGDPHRTIESPGVYQQVRLACEEFDVAGFAFPGVPGIQHFAHAGDVAWAITNGAGDYQDVYAEQLRREGDRVEALGPHGWEETRSRVETIEVRGGPDVDVEIVETQRGPVFSGDVDEGDAVSLRAASAVLGDLGFDSFLPLLRARTVADVDAALDRWVEPVNNVVVADRTGEVLYRLAGRVPVRAEANRHGLVPATDPGAGWTGWVGPLPRTEVPPDGHVITANERRGPESDPIGTEFAPPHRARRLDQLLEGRSGLTPADFTTILGDTFALSAATAQELVRRLDPDGPGRTVRQEILAWDCRMDAGSRGAAAFAAWRSALVRRLVAHPALAWLAGESPYDPIFALWLDVTTRVGFAVQHLVTHERPFGIDLPELATRALEDAAGHPGTWGATHVVTPLHGYDVAATGLEPPALPRSAVSGDFDVVHMAGSLPGQSDDAWRGAVARYVWDLADREASLWVVPLGASGDPRDPHHHDQLPLWVAGELVPVVTDWDRLREEAPVRPP